MVQIITYYSQQWKVMVILVLIVRFSVDIQQAQQLIQMGMSQARSASPCFLFPLSTHSGEQKLIVVVFQPLFT